MGSIMTSLYPTQLGLVEAAAPPDKRFKWRERRDQRAYSIPLAERTLAEIFRDEGFRTAAFVNQPALIVGEGFSQGFMDWYYPDTPSSIRHRTPGVSVEYKPWGPFLKMAASLDGRLVRELDGWLDRHADEKMFVWLHLLTPHRPYDPPAGYRTSPRRRSSIESYDGEVRYVDKLIGDVLASIEARVGRSRSVVIFTSDHGEAFGEHDMFEHGHTLHREVIHVPLILAADGLPTDRVLGSYVRTIDILPTILDIVGLGPGAPGDVRGSSFLPIINGEAADRPVFSEGMLYGSTERSLIANGHKLMYDEQDERYELFDLSEDRAEERSIIELRTDLAMSMRAGLSELCEELAFDYDSRHGEAAQDSVIADEEARRMLDALRSLGYLDD
jgi:arylsulfatase A-like enzyme